MKVKIFKSHECMSEHVKEDLVSAIKQKPNINLGLATGSTPKILYKRLIEDHQTNQTDYSNVKMFNLDEYINLSKTHKQSYHYYMKENFFDHINIDKRNINIPNPYELGVDRAITSYEERLKNHPIDIQILGLGSNGHIAFNEPGTSFETTTHLIDLTQETINDNARFFDSVKDVPKKAITMGIKTIMNARKIILMASGQNKAKAVYNLFHGPISTRCPASVLRQHPDVLITLDESAAQYIKEEQT